MTPLAMWYTGTYSQPNLELLTHGETEDYGTDYDGPIVREDNDEQISNLALNPDSVTRL